MPVGVVFFWNNLELAFIDYFDCALCHFCGVDEPLECDNLFADIVDTLCDTKTHFMVLFFFEEIHFFHSLCNGDTSIKTRHSSKFWDEIIEFVVLCEDVCEWHRIDIVRIYGLER